MPKQSKRLKDALTQVDIPYTENHIKCFLKYLDLLNDWNQRQNLTRITSPESQIYGHIVDSLLAASFFTERNILDVGSGAGLPGIPLAIIKPTAQLVLLDAQQKRISFLRQVCHELDLNNVSLVHQRIQDYHPIQKPELITCRALTSIDNIIAWTQHLKTDSNRIIAYKTIQDITPVDRKHKIIKLPEIPGYLESRCLIVL